MRRLVLAAIALFASCFGFDERLDACRRHEGVCAVADAGVPDAGTDAGADDAGCGLDPADLLFNGSYEVVTDAGIPGWASNPPVIRRTGGAAACLAWVEQSSTSATLELQGDFDLSSPAPMGTRFTISGFAKSLDQDPTPLVIQLRIRSGGYTAGRTQRLDRTGAWTPVSVDLELAETGSQLGIEIVTETPRSVGYDGFTVVRR